MANSEFFKNRGPFTAQEICELVGADLQNIDGDFEISDVAALDTAISGQISFFDNAKYKDQFTGTKASLCITRPQAAKFAPECCGLLLTDQPYKSYALIAQKFYPQPQAAGNIHPNAIIDPTAKVAASCDVKAGAVIEAGVEVGENTIISANSVIGENVKIGRDCHIAAKVSLTHCLIGDGVTIHPGASIGQDGFGFAPDPTGHIKVPQLGRVIIQDNVEIGANTCIDRGAGPDTVIGEGSWIDNLVQIGHNAKIGRGCIIVGQAGVAGSCELEDFVVLGGQVGLAGHLKIGMGTQISAQAGVIKSIGPGLVYGGTPAVPIRQWHKQSTMLARLATQNPTPKP
jgi:UDP-3-O-[3-hydroxymyristoyl] glucosamine N-acyltransferase